MLPAKSAYGQWPASGEIDIMESRGNNNLILDGRNIGNKLVRKNKGSEWKMYIKIFTN